MRPLVAFLLGAGLALALPGTALAQTPPNALDRPIGLGVRALTRAGDYALGGVGGQIRLHLHRRVSLEVFMDHLAGTESGLLRHDHEVGSTLMVNLYRGRSWTLHPLLGACALVAVAHAPQSEAVVNDIRFGLRAGLGAEWALGRSFTLQAQGHVAAWLGHAFDVYHWTADTRPTLSVRPAVQAVVSANYWF